MSEKEERDLRIMGFIMDLALLTVVVFTITVLCDIAAEMIFE